MSQFSLNKDFSNRQKHKDFLELLSKDLWVINCLHKRLTGEYPSGKRIDEL